MECTARSRVYVTFWKFTITKPCTQTHGNIQYSPATLSYVYLHCISTTVISIYYQHISHTVPRISPLLVRLFCYSCTSNPFAATHSIQQLRQCTNIQPLWPFCSIDREQIWLKWGKTYIHTKFGYYSSLQPRFLIRLQRAGNLFPPSRLFGESPVQLPEMAVERTLTQFAWIYIYWVMAAEDNRTLREHKHT